MSSDPNSHDPRSPSAAVALAPVRPTALERSAGPDEMPATTLGPHRGAPAGQHPHRSVTVAMVLRQKWLILGLWLAVSAPIIVGIKYLHVPQYRARAAVIVEPRRAKIAYNTDENRGSGNYRQHRNDQVANLRSAEVLNRVLVRSDVQETKWYKQKPAIAFGQPQSLLDRLRDDLETATPRDSSFIYVEMACSRPEDAQTIANAVIDEYWDFMELQFSDDDDIVMKVLDDKLQRLSLDVKARKSDIATLLEQSKLYTEAPDALVQQQRLRLDTKQAELRDLQSAIVGAETQLKRRSAEPAGDPTPDVPVVAEQPDGQEKVFAADPEWRRLNEAHKDAEFAVELGRNRLGDAHPELIRLQSLADNAARKLADYESDTGSLVRPTLTKSAAGDAKTGTGEGPPMPLEVYVADLRAQVPVLEAEIETERDLLKDTAADVRELCRLREELKGVEGQLEILRQNKIAMSTERDAPPAIKRRMAAKPSTPVNSKKRYMLMAMALFGGLALGIGAAYVRATTDQSVHNATDVLCPIETPFLGYIPRVRKLDQMSAMDEAVQSEHIRMIRTALLERVARNRGATVLVTSAGSGAGKTTVAMLLAKSLAHCGKRVLLVDADLRNPSVAKRMNLAGCPGLVDVLANAASDDQAITTNGVAGLDILPAGARSDDVCNSELLVDGIFLFNLKRWREKYDVVLVDAPPVVPVADARMLASQVDGAVFVIREGHCRRDEVGYALSALNVVGGRLLGSIFIGSRRHREHAPYYSYYYQPTANTDGALDARNS